jgi:tRNA1(Val) A37 N6-methylase TrmN6
MFLYQFTNGYCYNSDTHFLFNFICENLKQFKNIQGELLDIGSGSGILGLLLTRDYKKLQLNQVEIQKNFCFLSQKNAQINNINTILFQGDFLEIDFKKEFDFVVSNPPFYPSCVVQSGNENKKIARYNDNLPLKEFIKKVSKILKPKGQFYFCYDVKLLNDIIIYCKEFNLNIQNLQFLYPSKKKNASLVLVMARKNTKTLMKIASPLIMFDKNNNFTKLAQKIYTKCNTYSIKVY